jgi:DNA-binding NarL/FixJ family response regulator
MDILLADDHNLVREGLKPFLERLADDVTVIEAATLDEALDAARLAPSLGLIILDLMMPGMDGLAGLKTIQAEFPDIPTVILSGHVSRADVMAAVDAGAAGYIPKTISGTALISALRLVLDGDTYLPTAVLNDNGPAQAPAESASVFESLSAREREVLGHLVEGQTNKEIARALDLQEITVKVHVRNVYRKIGAANRAQAVKIALESGFHA